MNELKIKVKKPQEYLENQFDKIDVIIACPKCLTRMKEVWLVRKRNGTNLTKKRRKYVICPSRDCGFDLASIKKPKQNG